MRYRSSFTSFAYRDPLKKKKKTSWSHHTPCGILFPDLGSNPRPLQWKRSLNHWTTKEVLLIIKSTLCWKGYPFFIELLLHLCFKSVDRSYMGLLLVCHLFHWFVCLFTNTTLPCILFFYIVSLKAGWCKLSSFNLAVVASFSFMLSICLCRYELIDHYYFMIYGVLFYYDHLFCSDYCRFDPW